MGNWYRTGTVSVTNGSPDIVGVGTLWLTQASIGDIFLGPNLVEHEITAITDDTHLAVRQVNGTAAYAGTTASAQPYAIIRNFTSTLPAQLASQLAALMTTYHVTLDELTAWLSGTGTVTVHDAVGNSYSVQTPAAMNAVLSGRLVKSVAGGADVTLTTAEAANLFIELTGTLTANINVILPAGVRHNFILNNTSGAYTVTVKTAAGTGVALTQGKRGLLECDGTNVVNAQSQLGSVELSDLLVTGGAALAISGGANPAWGSDQRAVNIGLVGSVSSDIGSNTLFSSNLYYSSGWKFKANGYGGWFGHLNDGTLVVSTAGNNVSGAGAVATPATLVSFSTAALSVTGEVRAGDGVNGTTRLSVNVNYGIVSSVNQAGTAYKDLQLTGGGGKSLYVTSAGISTTADTSISIAGAVVGLSGSHSFKGNFAALANDGSTAMYTGAGVASTAGESAAYSSLWVRKDGTTGRSISAAGTVNASGADYAEYERNNGLVIGKGQVVGFKADGTLTDLFSEALRFGIKSTNPSYVGGDVWGTAAEVGARPVEPVFAAPPYAGVAEPEEITAQPAEPVLSLPASPVQQPGETAETFAVRTAAWQQHCAELMLAHDAALAQYHAALAAWQSLKDAYDTALAQHQADLAAHADAVAAAQLAFNTVTHPAYQADLAAFEARLEAARQLVDRIAYSGKVPVNVTGATPGDYLVAVAAVDGGITAIPVADPTFAQYKLAVGRVNRILPDGRAEVAVIVH